MTDKRQEVDAREAGIATEDLSAVSADLDFASAADLGGRVDGHDSTGSAPRCGVRDALTRDNPHLSRLTTGADEVEIRPVAAPKVTHASGSCCAINIASELAASVQGYVEAGIAPATRRAYRADLDHFAAWGGVIPSTEADLAGYLAAHAGKLAVATLVRRLAAISVAHEAHGLPNPARSPLVRATMRGIRRERGSAQRQAKPLLRDDLFAVLAAMGGSLRAVRDRALLLLGFAGGFRRSELCGLDFGDIERVRQGVIITLRRSKTDQEGAGRKIGIPHGRSKWCPNTALETWLEAAGIGDGSIFRPVDRHGRVSAERLSAEAVCLVVRERVAAAGYDPSGYSGHSLRAGLATSAVQAGVSTLKIRGQTGHASDAMLARYVRDGELFIDNAAGVLL
jgi:integrase